MKGGLRYKEGENKGDCREANVESNIENKTREGGSTEETAKKKKSGC